MQDSFPTQVLVCATTLEARFLLESCLQTAFSRIRWTRTPDYLLHIFKAQTTNIAFVVTGMGFKPSQEGLAMALEELKQVRSCVGFGFAGGLIKTAKPGDLVIPVQIQNDQQIFTPTEWLRMQLASHANQSAWRKLITALEVISSPADKAALYAVTEAEVVDMESAGWGEICQSRGIPWAIVRAVLDSAEDRISMELSKVVDRFGQPKWWTALQFFAQHPSQIPSALRLSPVILRKRAYGYVQVLQAWLRAQGKESSQHRHDPAVISKLA